MGFAKNEDLLRRKVHHLPISIPIRKVNGDESWFSEGIRYHASILSKQIARSFRLVMVSEKWAFRQSLRSRQNVRKGRSNKSNFSFDFSNSFSNHEK